MKCSLCCRDVSEARPGKKTCQSCHDSVTQKQLDRLAKGLCRFCERKAKSGSRCDYHKALRRYAHRALKATVVDGYGGRCACCGEWRLDFLTIDHVYNDGAARRANGESRGGELYRKLIKDGFPDDFQVLCMNCNYSKYLGDGSACAHQENPFADYGDSLKYSVIVADPPWGYRNFSAKKHGAVAAHYETMPYEDMAKIPVSRFAAEESVLFLWATAPKMVEAVDLIRAWDFIPVTTIPWIKTNRDGSIYCGIGFWFQSCCEYLLIGRRGHLRKAKSAATRGLLIGKDRQFYCTKPSKHSTKPESLQDWIEDRWQGPYLELFARRERPGWTCWGHDTGWHLTPDGVEPYKKEVIQVYEV